jgi:toxin ParE1/3/4
MEFIIAPKACSDIEAILAWTHDNFGRQMVEEYSRLIETAINEVAKDPDCLGSAKRAEIAENCRTYHLFHACKKAGARGKRIRKPRHFLLYRVRDDVVVEIGRVLHDSMDFEQHLPVEYQVSPK